MRSAAARPDSRMEAQAIQLPLLPVQPPTRLPVLDLRRDISFHALRVRSVLNSPRSTGMDFWSLNPYVGCEFGCSYCYARDTHRWALERTEGLTDGQTEGGWPRPASGCGARAARKCGAPPGCTGPGSQPHFSAGRAAAPDAEPGQPPSVHPSVHQPDPFERRILVKTDIATVLRRTLEPARVGATTILIGTATDPYQPAERIFGLTRQVLEALEGWRGLTLSLTTKSTLVTRDLDVLLRLAERHDLSVSLSLATTDPVLLRRLEPRTPLPHARLRALRTLTEAGLHAGVLLAPVLPGLADSWTSLAGVMEAAKGAGARYVVGMALRLGPAARSRFLPLLQREFPDLAPRYERHYTGRTNASRAYTRALSRRIRLLQEAFGLRVEGRGSRTEH